MTEIYVIRSCLIVRFADKLPKREFNESILQNVFKNVDYKHTNNCFHEQKYYY